MKCGVCLASSDASCPLLQIGQKHAVCPSMCCSEAGFTRRCRSIFASRFIIGWKNMFSVCIKKDSRRCAKFFQSCQVSDAYDSIILARLTSGRALPLPPSSCCPLFFCFYICCFYKFRNVSVRKCRMVQLAKFLMQLISISTNSLNEMTLSLRPIISTATRQ